MLYNIYYYCIIDKRFYIRMYEKLLSKYHLIFPFSNTLVDPE